MAKTTAPLLSFGATGQIGQTQVYSKWRGVAYARRYTIPANPQSVEQTLTRNAFSLLAAIWKLAPALLTEPWNLYAQGQSFLGRNAFQGQNIKTLRGQLDMSGFIGSPGAKGGLPPSSVIVTPAATSLSVAFTNPAGPTGWVLESAIAMAIPDQDPSAPFTGVVVAAEDATTQATVALPGLITATPYVVSSWLKWAKPDGKPAYSPSLVELVSTL